MKQQTTLNFYGLNTAGRDFVVGDLHGCFSALENRLKAADFDPSVDRLFAVGDLIDRGPESLRVLEFLAQPWFHAVRGNHEAMFLDLYSDGPVGDDAVEAVCRRNGMNWWIRLEDRDRDRCLKAFAALPIAIQVETTRGTVGLVHADVPEGMDWPRFLRLISAGDEKTIQIALWSRRRMERANNAGVPGIGRLFVGHTIGDSVRQLGNVYFIDSGAFLKPLCGEDTGPTLSMLIAKTADLSGARFDDSSLLSTNASNPFGQYLQLRG